MRSELTSDGYILNVLLIRAGTGALGYNRARGMLSTQSGSSLVPLEGQAHSVPADEDAIGRGARFQLLMERTAVVGEVGQHHP